MTEKMNAKALARLREEEAERASWLPLKERAVQRYSECTGVCRGCGLGRIEEIAVVRADAWKYGYSPLYGGYDRMLRANRPLYKDLHEWGYPAGYVVICVPCFKTMVRLQGRW